MLNGYSLVILPQNVLSEVHILSWLNELLPTYTQHPIQNCLSYFFIIMVICFTYPADLIFCKDLPWSRIWNISEGGNTTLIRIKQTSPPAIIIGPSPRTAALTNLPKLKQSETSGIDRGEKVPQKHGWESKPSSGIINNPPVFSSLLFSNLIIFFPFTLDLVLVLPSLKNFP